MEFEAMYLVLALIVGLLLGGVICYVAMTKLSNKYQLQDELTRTKRELASAQRLIDDFFRNASDLYAQIEKSHKNFASFMAKSAKQLTPNHSSVFENAEELPEEPLAEEVEEEAAAEEAKSGAVKEPENVPEKKAEEETAKPAAEVKAKPAKAEAKAKPSKAEAEAEPAAEQPKDYIQKI